jgi:two-component system OmpR family sensor kinase
MTRPGLRRRLVLTAIGVVAVALALITVGFNLVLDRRLSDDAQSVVRSRVQAGLALVSVEHGHLVVEDTPHDNILEERVWVYEGTRAIERARVPAGVNAEVERLATVRRITTVEADGQLLLAHPIRDHGRQVGTVVGAVSLLPYQHSRRLTLITSVALSVAMLAALAAIVWLLVGRALRPVARMTAQAAEWSDHDVDRRFALGPARDELTGLAATLDALLGRLSASLRHEQRFSAELAHELRTPLTKLRAEAELALARERPAGELREALAAVVGYTDRMSAVVDTLMAAAERAADPRGSTVDAREAAEAAVAACAAEAAGAGVAVAAEAAGPGPIEVDADRDLTVQILVPLLSNAIRYGRSSVRLDVARDGEAVAFAVRDDGPGLDPGEAESVFEPGVRGGAGNGSPGAGLGLALARRLARLAGGDVVAEPAPGPGGGAGGRFVVRLPAS